MRSSASKRAKINDARPTGTHHPGRGTIADVEDLIVIGSQAVLGEFPDAPAELLVSHEADVYPALYPERSDLIDATIGEGSPFEKSFGYYAHGVADYSGLASGVARSIDPGDR